MMTMAMPASAPTGVKRHATDDLDSSQRLAKRLELLDLSKRSIATPRAATSLAHLTADVNGRSHKIPTPVPSPSKPHLTRPKLPQYDSMELENTRHTVYVHDLDAELEEIESDEERPVFLSDIEKHLMKIPRHVLLDDPTKRMTEDMQLVLYGAPVSLTVSEENDSVRRAIIESRRRAQQNQPFTVPDSKAAFPVAVQHAIADHRRTLDLPQSVCDVDEMEIG